MAIKSLISLLFTLSFISFAHVAYLNLTYFVYSKSSYSISLSISSPMELILIISKTNHNLKHLFFTNP